MLLCPINASPNLKYLSYTSQRTGGHKMKEKKKRNQHIKQNRGKSSHEKEKAVKVPLEEAADKTLEDTSDGDQWTGDLTDEELDKTMDPFSGKNCFFQLIYLIIILGALILVILYVTGIL